MAAKDINIILQGYQLTDKDGNSVDINSSDEFRVYIENETDGKIEQEIYSGDSYVNIFEEANTAVISISQTDNFGYLTIQVKPNGLDYYLTATTDGTNVATSNFIPDTGASFVTPDLFDTTFFSPQFVYIIIPGCSDDSTYGPFPDIYGFCRPDPFTGEDRLPNAFGYCKDPDYDNVMFPNTGYSVCNFDPDSNDESNDDCVYTANGVVGTPETPFDAVQDDTYCDCYGHTLDCAGMCISQHQTGECSATNTAASGNLFTNGFGCNILTCSGEGDPTPVDEGQCISADQWIAFRDDGGNDNFCDIYYCSGVFQGIGHPLVGTDYVDSDGIATFNCGLNNCEDCNGECSSNDVWSDEVGDCNPQECIGGTSTDAIYGCAPFWIPEDEQGDNWICEQDWSKDCFGNCPEHEDYQGACGRGSASGIIVYGDGEYSPEIQTILESFQVDNHCGIDCAGICGGDSVFDVCGVCGGNGYEDVENDTDGEYDSCDCDGNVDLSCGCGEPAPDECGVCGGNGIPEGECDCNSINGVPPVPHYLDCKGDCVLEEDMAVIDDCGVCSGGNTGVDGYFFTLPNGDSCEQYTSIDCLIGGQYCSCGDLAQGGVGNTFDCRADSAYLLPADEEYLELQASCGGALVYDACQDQIPNIDSCGGACESCGCGCNEANLDICEVCGGIGLTIYDDPKQGPEIPNGDSCPNGPDDYGLTCNCAGDECDICGICGGTGYGTSTFSDFEYNGVTIPGVSGIPNCDCSGTPPQLWCYDGDGDGIGCYDCITEPVYSCNNPGGTEFGGSWVGSGEGPVEMDSFCSQTSLEEICNSGYDECGVCGGNSNDYVCSSTAIDPYCCDTLPIDGFLTCDCNDVCTNIPPAGNLGYDEFGNLSDTGYYDCSGTCRGDAYLDTCNKCCVDGFLYDSNTNSVTNIPCGIPLGDCDCNGNQYDCTYNPEEEYDSETNLASCGGNQTLDNCGICGGDCIGDGICDEENDCGDCFVDWNPVTCDTDNPDNTFNQICNCEGNVCDDCGVCGGSGSKEYYYDEDGDGVVCDAGGAYFCDGDPNLGTLCGINSNPCWVLVDGYDGETESFTADNNLCDCPYTYDNCGRCVQEPYVDQPLCQIDGSGQRLPDCVNENDPGLGITCNSKYCKYGSYECNQQCDDAYYIYEYIPEFGTSGYIRPELQPGGLGERPQLDQCGDCRKPGCSNYLYTDLPDESLWANLTTGEIYGDFPVCDDNISYHDNPVPTNQEWNSQCVDCAGVINGSNFENCDGVCESTISAIGNGICNGTTYTCDPKPLYPGHPYANVDLDGDGINDHIDFQCDGDDCRGCDGECRAIPYEDQFNRHGEFCGCGEPDTLTEENGCCLGGVQDCEGYCSESDNWIGDDDFTPDSGRDCAGICQGDAEEQVCCDTVKYCFGDDGVVNGTSCLDVAACGCYSDPTACNYNPTNQSNVEAFLTGKNTYELFDYRCVFPGDDGYFTIDVNSGFVTDEFIELCDNYGVGVGDCCNCEGQLLDCDLSCGGENIRKQYYHDYDCDGLGGGEPTNNYYCSDELPDTDGCWSLTQDEDELGDFCRIDNIWTNAIPSSMVGGRMLPNESFICKPKESYGGYSNTEVTAYCSGIQDAATCSSEEQTPECKWEPDYFFGIDDCGNCHRLGLGEGDINPAFNQYGESSQDCNGCCNYGSTSGCGSPYEEGVCVDGSTECNFDGTITQDHNGIDQYPGLDQCGDCHGNGQRCAGCMYVGALDGPGTEGQGCTTIDGLPMPCLFDCSAHYDFAANTETACCDFTQDCMGNTLENDWGGAGGPAVTDWCGVCTGGTSGVDFNVLLVCGCCPSQQSSYYDNYNLGFSAAGSSDITPYTHYGECTFDGETYVDFDTFINDNYEGSGSYTIEMYPNFKACDGNGSCFDDNYIDACGICNDPDDAWVITDNVDFNYSTPGDSTSWLLCSCEDTDGDGVGTPLYHDDCGACGLQQFNQLYQAEAQCSCDGGTQSFWDECPDLGDLSCGGDGFVDDCLDSNDCENMDCLGVCGGENFYNVVNGIAQCCLGQGPNDGDKDSCGVCFGGDLDLGCDGVCFSGNVQQDCGCGAPGTLGTTEHCFDADGDGLGDPTFKQNICANGTPLAGFNPAFQEYYSIPADYSVPEPNTYTTNCDGDPEPDCPTTTDECGQCGGTNVICFGCNIEEACNYGMRKDGNGYCTTIPCTFADNNTCIMPIDCDGECDDGTQYCPPTATINGTEDVPICEGGWGTCQDEICIDSLDCPANGCQGNKLTYCPGEIQEEVCWYPDDCGVCVEGNAEYNTTGSWTCNECFVPSDIACSTCACTGCTDPECEGNGLYDDKALYPINPTYQTVDNDDAFCGILDCDGNCGGYCVVDECGSCTGADCTGGEYNSGIDGDLNPCGCDDRVLYYSYEQCPQSGPCYCNDCDPNDQDCRPSGCDGNEWFGCNSCGEQPDLCGNCSDDGWGGYGVPNLACAVCNVVGACNYVATIPDGQYGNPDVCLWNNINGDCVCQALWTNPDEHNNFCAEGGVYVDDCDPPNIVDSLDDPDFNNCQGCKTEGAVNYNPNLGPNDPQGTCFFGDLVRVPSSTIGAGLDYYVLRPAGNDTQGVQCNDGEIETYTTCNENYGGFESISPEGDLNEISAYKLEIFDSNNVSQKYWYALSSIHYFDYSGSSGNEENENPECPILYDIDDDDTLENIDGSINIHTFVACGVGYRFIKNDTYRIELTIYDTDGDSYTLTNELEIGGSIDWEVSIQKYENPWQGMELPFPLPTDFKYKKRDFESVTDGGYDNDGRPSLGTFYFSDDPNNNKLINSSNLDDSGYIESYFRESFSMSGKKWGDNGGIGKKYNGLLENIQNECGVDLAVYLNTSDLTTNPTSNSGEGSNNGCFMPDSGGGYVNWLPDILPFTQRSLTGNKSRLWEYYDSELQPELYQETTTPTEVIFYFQPTKFSSTPWGNNRETEEQLNSINPMYLLSLDWGDGEIEYETEAYNLNENQELRHTYSKPGVYSITGYWFSIHKGRTCVNIYGEHDGRNLACSDDQHCRGVCSNTDTGGICLGGSVDGNQCNSHDDCYFLTNSLDPNKNIVCQSADLEPKYLHNFGVNRFFKFTSRINLNEPENYSQHPYILNETNTNNVVVGGISKNGIYYKNILRQLGYFPDLPEEEPLDLQFQFQYDDIITQYALAQMDENYTTDDLIAFQQQRFDGVQEIYKGKYKDYIGELGKSFGNLDLGQVRYYNTSISMAEMLGFDDEVGGNPGIETYYKNIIPQDYWIGLRTGLEYDEFDITSVNPSDTDGQIWIGQNEYGNNYYYPVLPKLNVYGYFDSDNYGLQGNRIPFGTTGRNWDGVDIDSLATSLSSNDFVKYLLIDIDFSSESDGKLQDLSGNGNDGFIFNDYRIDYEEGTRVPEKIEGTIKPIIDKSEKQF